MDRYLFRGKRMDNGEWETGGLVILRKGCHDEQTFIADKMTGFLTPVDRKTVGQCTGLRDKNGVLIFEGDIVKMHRFLFDGSEYEDELIGKVVYDESECAFCLANLTHDGVKKYMGYDAD